MKVKSFSISSKRYPNEDRMAIQNMGIYGIAIVLADGMGGLSLGHLAADVVTSTVADYLMKNYEGYAEKEVLHKALERADQEALRRKVIWVLQ